PTDRVVLADLHEKWARTDQRREVGVREVRQMAWEESMVLTGVLERHLPGVLNDHLLAPMIEEATGYSDLDTLIQWSPHLGRHSTPTATPQPDSAGGNLKGSLHLLQYQLKPGELETLDRGAGQSRQPLRTVAGPDLREVQRGKHSEACLNQPLASHVR